MKKKELVIVIATLSNDKIEGIKDAFSEYFPKEEFEIKIFSSKTGSGVLEQPFGNDTYEGAYNRINNVKEKYKDILAERKIKVDYYVSCEAGIDNTNQIIIKGTVTPLYASEQVVCIYNPEKDSYSFGKNNFQCLCQVPK